MPLVRRFASLAVSCALAAACDTASLVPESDGWADTSADTTSAGGEHATVSLDVGGRRRAARAERRPERADMARREVVAPDPKAEAATRALAEEAAAVAAAPPFATACEAGWVLVAAGPHVLAHSDREAWVSHDGGVTFTQAVAARRVLRDVHLTSTGTVVAHVDGRWRAILADGEVVAVGLPNLTARRVREAELHVAGDWLAWVDADPEAPVVHATNDFGATWQVYTLPDIGNIGTSISLGEEGALEVISGYEAGCGGGAQWWYRLGLADGERSDHPWPLDTPEWKTTSHGVALGGYLETFENDAWSVAPAIISGEGDMTLLSAPTVGLGDVDEVTLLGEAQLATVAGLVFDLRSAEMRLGDDEEGPGRAEPVAWLPVGGTVLGRDAAGRPLARDGANVVTLEAGAWHILTPLPEGCREAWTSAVSTSDGGIVALAGAEAFRWDGTVWTRTLAR